MVNAKDLKIEMKSRWKEEWSPTTLEKFLEDVRFTKEIIQRTGDKRHSPDDFSDERAIDALARGLTVSTPAMLFRLAEGVECPRCHAKFIEEYGALSRIDNETLICDACGNHEAISDYLSSQKKAK